MGKKLRTCMAGMLCVAMLSATGCTANDRQAADHRKGIQTRTNTGTPPRMLNQPQNGRTSIFSVEQDAAIPVVTKNNENYIPLLQFLKLMQYRTVWNPNTKTYSIGDTDVAYKIQMNSTRVVREDSNVTLASPPIMIQGAPYIPVSMIHDVFQEDMDYAIQDHTLFIRPSAGPIIDMEAEDRGETDHSLRFGDNPKDPAKAKKTMIPVTEGNGNDGLDQAVWVTNPEEALPALTNIDTNALINTAKRYLGIKYVFGAAPYSVSGVFDCSSFTRYVFGKYGIQLPRTARAQAKQGIWVSRKMLQTGDLLFFYVPGRFKSNKIVGHVGIYMGNSMMIHTIPGKKINGVQIANINTPYWQKVFITAKRFVS